MLASPPPFDCGPLARARLVGSPVRTPTFHATAAPGDLGSGFMVMDGEQGAFDRAILAVRAAGTAPVVGVAEPSAPRTLSVLDDGAAAGLRVAE